MCLECNIQTFCIGESPLTARLSLHAELAVDYFEVRSADAQEKLLNDTVDAYSKALELTKNRFEGGAAPRSDVAQAQTQLDGARVLATDIKVQRAQYEHALAILIGKPPAAFSLPLFRSMCRLPNCRLCPSLCPLSFWSDVLILQRPSATWRQPMNRLE